MDESFANLQSSHLLGSVPAVISDDKRSTNVPIASVNEGPSASMQIFPPNLGNNTKGYQTLESPTEGPAQQPSNNWKGFFNVYSYTQYFDVDTDVVLNRLMSSLYPTSGDFFNKIDANPDLYGLVWICTTLVFVLASLGNCATYLVKKRTDSNAPWIFDLPLLIPVEFLRWVIILLAGSASSCFVALNLRSYLETNNDITVVMAAAFGLQMVLSIFIKVWFFP
ncbi:unnamed protein product [Arabidopsis thaliana]|uniref:(thale cress) hypothetical protein n=1 Tax=Arabidopsis thaliana TaxID=3702 RepID=A0A7G2EFM6_ARATH|nr:unnamed protein product [Arabidopsis thaliana]